MKIIVNGEGRDVAEGFSLLELFDQLELRPNMTVVERNGEIIDPAEFSAVHLEENDVLELIRFVGGG